MPLRNKANSRNGCKFQCEFSAPSPTAAFFFGAASRYRPSRAENQIRYPRANNTKDETISFLQVVATAKTVAPPLESRITYTFFTTMRPTASPSLYSCGDQS